MIITYHPIWFRPLSRLNGRDAISRVILKCAFHGIPIFSPHTALDSTVGGINDWLISGVGQGTISILQPNPAIEGTGQGRKAELDEQVSLSTLIERIKIHLSLSHVRVALASDKRHNPMKDPMEAHRQLETCVVKSVACVAGSGGSVLRGVEADVYLTGEMTHHDILASNSSGKHQINFRICRFIYI